MTFLLRHQEDEAEEEEEKVTQININNDRSLKDKQFELVAARQHT